MNKAPVIKQEKNSKVSQWTIEKLVKLQANIDLDTDYQREKVWSDSEKKKFFDSILREIDIPKIYFAKTSEETFECVDGKQRLTSIFEFFKGELSFEWKGKTVNINNKDDLSKEIIKDINRTELTITLIKKNVSDEYIRETFVRLQLGKPLNSGEKLKAKTGFLRDFIFKEIGKKGPFFKSSGLSDKRFSKEFTLAQIALNSFYRRDSGFKNFKRTRLADLVTFFEENIRADKNTKIFCDEIKKTLNEMEQKFGKKANLLRSRAVVVSAYHFIEELIATKRGGEVQCFVEFYLKLLEDIKIQLSKINKGEFEKVNNSYILSNFQTYISQASVEPYSLKNRHEFLKEAFEFYKKRGEIISSK